jgi:transketolase
MTEFKGSREAFTAAMTELADKDPRVVFVSADSLKAARATKFAEKYPDRYFEAGIAEQNAVAIAAGLAACGLKPYVVTYGGFITMRACEQLRTFCAYTDLDVTFGGLNGGLIGGEREGVTHQALEDIGIVRTIPGVKVFAPADAAETYSLAKAARELTGPVYFRLGSGREVDIFAPGMEVELGKAKKIIDYGSDVLLLSSGFVLDRVLKAAELLKTSGIGASVVEVHSLKPLDAEGIVKELKRCKAAVTVEDHTVIGGLGSAIAELAAERCPCRIKRLGIQDVFPESGPADTLADKYGLSPEAIADAARMIATGKGC